MMSDEVSVSEQTHDALVLGAGPAGMAMAAELRQRGLSVAIVSPQWPAPWPNQYGAWLDELPAWAQGALSHTYEAPRVRAAPASRITSIASARAHGARVMLGSSRAALRLSHKS